MKQITIEIGEPKLCFEKCINNTTNMCDWREFYLVKYTTILAFLDHIGVMGQVFSY
jgi:hypothetical protein